MIGNSGVSERPERVASNGLESRDGIPALHLDAVTPHDFRAPTRCPNTHRRPGASRADVVPSGDQVRQPKS
jgi:hypothetical protein